MVIGKGLELLRANGFRFEINQLLFADDIALDANLEEKLCRLVVSLVDCKSSPAPHTTRPQAANFITSGASCDTAAIYRSSISCQKQASSQQIFNSSIKSFMPLKRL